MGDYRQAQDAMISHVIAGFGVPPALLGSETTYANSVALDAFHKVKFAEILRCKEIGFQFWLNVECDHLYEQGKAALAEYRERIARKKAEGLPE